MPSIVRQRVDEPRGQLCYWENDLVSTNPFVMLPVWIGNSQDLQRARAMVMQKVFGSLPPNYFIIRMADDTPAYGSHPMVFFQSLFTDSEYMDLSWNNGKLLNPRNYAGLPWTVQ